MDRDVLLLLLAANPTICDPVVPVVACAGVSSTMGGDRVEFGGCVLVGVSSVLLPDEAGWLGEPVLLGLISWML